MPSPPPSPPPSGITSIQTLTDYLASRSTPTSPKVSSITPLTGGTANFVFRVNTTTTIATASGSSGDISSNGTAAGASVTSGTSSTIIKHAEPYIAASGGSIRFPVQRMDFEVGALRAVGASMALGDGSRVKVPEVLEYDAAAKVLTMSDGGQRTLKAAYEALLGEGEVGVIGERLGMWLAGLHYATRETRIGEGGNEGGKRMYRWAYNHLGEVAERFGLDVGFCAYVDGKYGALLLAATDEVCICHGDFWPGNVLLADDDDGDGGDK
ncbi:MAG: hypothetical protein Q9207_006808, partial [Kuettlingeria erythrocarpa]